MTIHKAKGLEFPVVLVLLYGTSSRGFDYVVAEEDDQIVLLKLDQKIVASAPQFQGPYEEEVLKERVNLLNSLYVSFTRAEEELYVIGVRKGDGKTPRPLDLLPGHEFLPSVKPDRTVQTPLEPERIALLLHPEEARPSSAAFDSRGKLALEDRRRGEFIHRVLSLIEYGEEAAGDRLGSMILRVSDEMRVEYDPEEMKGIVRGILAHGEIGELFERRPGRVVRREEEIVNEEGRLFRIDRLLLDKDRVVVIDWKTGREREAESQHEAQMKNYLRILEAVYPGRNREGMIVYVEQGEVKRVD
jgi:ATP-dependent exoDNAse (exonuclease V) beta subunit